MTIQKLGKVYLVGGGPGDPGLITLRGCQCLAAADAVLYDYLVNPRILSHARSSAELVCLGRHGAGRLIPQAEINDKLVALARQGKKVVRLKGGDPTIFARAAEEIAALEAAEIPYEVVPGITAALAVGGYTGIPLTEADNASAVALITAHERDDKQSPGLDYAALATFPGTLVFYMGVTTAADWSRALMNGGKPADTPAAIVRRCTWPDQQTVLCTLGTLSDGIQKMRLRPPALFVIGPVAKSAALNRWFADRPLFGRRVVVTRARHQADSLTQSLEELGAQVFMQPAIEISAPADWSPVDRAIQRFDEFDWLVFSSANGVDALVNRLLETRDLRALAKLKIAAIGPGTADELAKFHLRADVIPEGYRAESLAGALESEARNGARFLVVRASRGREVLAEELSAAGGKVEQIVVYTSSDVPVADPQTIEQLRAGTIDWLTVTSSAIARSLAAMLGDSLRNTKLASISPITSATLRELGHEPAVEASAYTMEGLVAAILARESAD